MEDDVFMGNLSFNSSNLDSRFSIVGHGSLRIDALNPQDSGTYTCRATNEEDSIDAVAMLSVHGRFNQMSSLSKKPLADLE